MRKNKLKEIFKTTDGFATSGWLHIPNSWTAEIMANACWDCVTVDMQHGLMNIETAMQMLQAISTTNTVPLARSLWNEPSGICGCWIVGLTALFAP